MFNLLKNSNNENTTPHWLAELKETETRWFSFLEKMEAKMDELCTASIPELKEMAQGGDQQTLYKVLSGVKGQLENIHKRVNDTYEEKVSDVYYRYQRVTSVQHPHYDILSQFRDTCSNRYHKQFDKKLEDWRNKIDESCKRDYEKEYQKILDEYENIKDKFTCVQCSSPIRIEKIFFLSTYITCHACQTQNTYEPSSQARHLEHLGRDLAEQRTAHLLKAIQDAPLKQQELYLQAHNLELSLIQEKDKKVIDKKTAQINTLRKQREDIENNRPVLYQTYLRAMFDEWNKINPDLQEEHEKFYNRLLTDYKQTKNI